MATVTTTYSSLTELVSGLVTAPDYRDYFDDWRAPYDAFVDAAEGFGLTFDGFGTGTVLSGGGPGIATWTINGSNLVIPGTWTINSLALTDFGGGSLLVTAAAGGVKFNTSTTAMTGSIAAMSFSLGSRSVELEGSGPASGTANFTVKHLEINDSIAGGYQLILESTAGVVFNNNSDSPSFMTPISGTITSIDLTIGDEHLTASGISIAALTFYNADTEGEITALVNSIFGGNNTHTAFGNDETLLGGGGNDIYDFSTFTPGAVSELPNGGTDLVKTQFSYELDDNIENAQLMGAGNDRSLTGNNLANKLTGSTGNDSLDGGLGKDTLAGGAGDDSYTANLVNLTAATLGIADIVGPEAVGGGIDTLLLTADDSVAQNTTPLVLLLGANIDNLSFSATTNPLLINATGNLLNNQIIGNDANNLIDGGLGADSLTGGGGDDTFLLGQAGDIIVDSVEGGGIDTVLLGNALNPFRDISATELDHVRFTGTGAIALTGNSGGNKLTGGAGADTLDGGAGSDTLTGGAGNDRYLVDNAGDVVVDSGGIDTLVAAVTGVTLGTGIENLILNADGTGTGNSLNNVLTDGEGTVTLVGGLGNDTYNITNDDDADEVNGGGGTKDLVVVTLASGQTATLDAGIENLTLIADEGVVTGNGNDLANLITGSAFDDSLSGGGGNDTLLGNAGHDTLEGGSGKNSLAGGLGDDRYIASLFNPTLTTVALDAAIADTGGIDTLVVTAGETVFIPAAFNLMLHAAIENLDVSGVDGQNLIATGNALNNVITGNAGNNKIDGGTGNDSLDGGDGSDTLLGGAGNDTLEGGGNGAGPEYLDGGLGNDLYYEHGTSATYLISQAGDSVVDGGEASGTDTVIVSATGNAAFLNITGDNEFLDNVTFTGTAGVAITGNNSSNVLKGGGGADTIDGGVGGDSLVGGAGNDLLVADSSDDTVDGGLGTDTLLVDLATWFALQDGAGVEILQLGTGTNVMGNQSANRLIGNDAVNILWGGGGNDTVTGGLENDIFVLDRVGAGQVVRITDYSAGNDRIGLYVGSAQFQLILAGGIAAEEVASSANGAATGAGPQLVYNSTTGNLYYDANGAGAGQQTLIAVFEAKPATLSNLDFMSFNVV